jgi:hypothetical protein
LSAHNSRAENNHALPNRRTVPHVCNVACAREVAAAKLVEAAAASISKITDLGKQLIV